MTIYGGAVILGGNTVIGRGSTIGGAVFLTQSVPPYHTVTMKPPQLKVSSQRRRRSGAGDTTSTGHESGNTSGKISEGVSGGASGDENASPLTTSFDPVI